MKPLGIGVVGAGNIGVQNAREAARIDSCAVAGVFDVNQKSATDLASRLAVTRFPSYEEMLASEEVEAVLICVPNHLHKEMSIAAADQRKHILIERPIANSLKDAEEVIRQCRRAGVGYTVNFALRYLPVFVTGRSLIEHGALGDVAGVQILSHVYKDRGYWAGARSPSPGDWRSSKDTCGLGLTIDPVSHYVDAVRFMTGLRATRVYGEYDTLASPSEVEDICSISCRYENRAVGTISTSSIMRGIDQIELRIWGTKGAMVIDLTKGTALSFYSARRIQDYRPAKVHRLTKFPTTSWTADWLAQFARAVRAGVDAEISLREGWESLAFLATVNHSLREGRALPVPDFPE